MAKRQNNSKIKRKDTHIVREIKIHEDMRKLQSKLVWATFFLTLGTIVMGLGTVYQAYQTKKLVELSYYQATPKVDVSISSPKMTYLSNYKTNYFELLRKDNVRSQNKSTNDFWLAVTMKIQNVGPKSVKLKSIKHRFSCGVQQDSEIPFDRSISLIKPSSNISIDEMILVHYIQMPSDEGDCKIIFNFKLDSFVEQKEIPVRLK